MRNPRTDNAPSLREQPASYGGAPRTAAALREIDNAAGRAPLHEACKRFAGTVDTAELHAIIAKGKSVEAAIAAVELHRRGIREEPSRYLGDVPVPPLPALGELTLRDEDIRAVGVAADAHGNLFCRPCANRGTVRDADISATDGTFCDACWKAHAGDDDGATPEGYAWGSRKRDDAEDIGPTSLERGWPVEMVYGQHGRDAQVERFEDGPSACPVHYQISARQDRVVVWTATCGWVEQALDIAKAWGWRGERPADAIPADSVKA